MRNAPPRVALFVGHLTQGKGGISRVARLIARVCARLVREGRIEADACTLLDDEPAGDLGIPVRVCRGSRWRFISRCHLSALSHTHFIFDTVGLSRARAWLPGLRRPSLALIYGVEVWEEARKARLAAARRAEGLVSISHYTRRRAEALHGCFDRARVCWLATENDQPPPPRDRTGPPRVLVVSRVDESYKGHGLLVDCWPEVAAALPAARLTFIGGGPRLEALRSRVAASPRADQIDVLGFIPDQELEEWYRRASVFALPSRGEGFGVVYIEAMRHGLPILATVHDAGQEINLDGLTGFNVNLDRPRELPTRLIQLLQNPAQAAALGACGFQRWQEHFRYQVFEERFVPLLDEFLRTGHLDGGGTKRPGKLQASSAGMSG